MSLNPLAPTFLPPCQSSSDPPISLCNPTTMSLPLAQLFSGMPPQLIPSHAPSINQPNTDGTFILPFIEPRNQSKQYAAAHQPPPGSSSLLSSPPQHQANCPQAIHKTIQQFNQHLKAEHLDRQTLQLIVLQLQNDFALLHYLLFSPVETISNKDIAVKNSAIRPLHNPNSNPNPTSSPFPLPCIDEPKPCRFTPVGAVGPPRAKTINSVDADFQPTPNTQEASPTMVQNLTSRICKPEKLFADDVATYTFITAGIHSQYFLLYIKTRQLQAGNADVMIWKISSVKLVFDSANFGRPSSDPLIESATHFSCPIFRTHPHGYNFFIEFYPYGIGPATGKCASVFFTLFPGNYDNLLQWPLWKLIHVGIRDQLDPLNTWIKTIEPDQDTAYKKPTVSTKTGVATTTIKNFIPICKLLSETEDFLIDGSSFIEIKISDPLVLKPQAQTSFLFPFPLNPSIIFTSLSVG